MFPSAKFIALAATTAIIAGPAFAQSDFQDCLQTIRGEALKQGVPAATIDTAFRGLTPDSKVLELDSRQPEFSLTYGRYMGNAITADRVVKGQQKLQQWRGLLGDLEREYGVAAQYLV